MVLDTGNPDLRPARTDLKPVAVADNSRVVLERRYLQRALERTGGNVTHAAAQAGVSQQLFRRLMRRHGIERESFLPG